MRHALVVVAALAASACGTSNAEEPRPPVPQVCRDALLLAVETMEAKEALIAVKIAYVERERATDGQPHTDDLDARQARIIEELETTQDRFVAALATCEGLNKLPG